MIGLWALFMFNLVCIMVIDYLKKILIVKVYDVVVEIELKFVLNLLVCIGNCVYFKCEDD